MREPTSQELTTARRAVAAFARKVREATAEPAVRGSLATTYPDENAATLHLSVSGYDHDRILTAVRAMPQAREVLSINPQTIEVTIPLAPAQPTAPGIGAGPVTR